VILYETRTIIVETTGFNDRRWSDDAGHPRTDDMNVTERFSPSVIRSAACGDHD
jgi:hypothetical protein